MRFLFKILMGITPMIGLTFNSSYHQLKMDFTQIGQPIGPDSTINNFCQDANNNFWISDNSGNLFLSKDLTTFTKILDSSKMQNISSISCGKNNEIYIASNVHGLWKGDSVHGFTRLDKTDFPDYEQINNISYDSNDIIWVTTEFSGLWKSVDDGLTFIHQDFSYFRFSRIRSFYEDNNKNMWLTTDKYLWKSEDKGYNWQAMFNVPDLGFIYQTSDNVIWVGGPNGLYFGADGGTTFAQEGLFGGHYASSMVEIGKTGSFFVTALNDGLWYGQTSFFEKIKTSGISPDAVYGNAFIDSKNKFLWVGTCGQGLWTGKIPF